MKTSILEIKKAFEPYSGVVYFVVILLLSHFIWKFSIIGDDSDTLVTLFGIDISAPFNLMAAHVAKATTAVLHFFGIEVQLQSGNIIRHINDQAVRIVWSCTGIKQAYIFVCILLFYSGPIRHKLWYIPSGLILVYLFNIFRISVITALVGVRPEWFEFLHEQLFKYLFYALIFGIWVLWEEKLVIKK
jgi:exosortase/archaeosortase family protein